MSKESHNKEEFEKEIRKINNLLEVNEIEVNKYIRELNSSKKRLKFSLKISLSCLVSIVVSLGIAVMLKSGTGIHSVLTNIASISGIAGVFAIIFTANEKKYMDRTKDMISSSYENIACLINSRKNCYDKVKSLDSVKTNKKVVNVKNKDCFVISDSSLIDNTLNKPLVRTKKDI